ncbi:MAG: phosphotransferase [Sandaracinaceae bacterium]|nr:phosphotransferase [Sandaracinaceae bacterium]
MSEPEGAIPAIVREAYGLEGATLTPIATGWINRTLLVERGAERFVLQRLHPVFSGEVNRDIDAITRHLAGQGLVTPRIVRARDGALWVEAERPWRALSYVEGETLDTLGTPARARSAGALAGRFHRALAGLEHTFAFTRPGAHDTALHLAKLRRVRAQRWALAADERARADALADAVLAYALPSIGPLPTRIVHGDLKATNLRFEGETAIAVLDLDTLAHGTIPVDLGDALRSWCNPRDESDRASRFDATVFAAAIEGYASATRGWLAPEEARAIVPATETIALELAARFAADVYEDAYFGFDAIRYPSRRAHNLARVEAQLALAGSIRDQAVVLEALVESAYGR